MAILKQDRITGLLLMFLALSLGFASCGSNNNEPNAPRKPKHQVSLSLPLEVTAGLPLDGMKALQYKVEIKDRGDGTSSVVPIIELPDNAVVPVHTFLACVNQQGQTVGTAYKVFNWIYRKGKNGNLDDNLYLTTGNNRIDLEATSTQFAPVFTDGSTTEAAFASDQYTWYISGIIGGKLEQLSGSGSTSERVIRIIPTTKLKRLNSNGIKLEDLEVPYTFAWTKIDLANSGPDKGAKRKAKVNFTRRGAVIAYRLGNNQPRIFTAKSFLVTADGFGDKGYFKIKSFNRATDLGKHMAWSFDENSVRHTMKYTFDSSFINLPQNTGESENYGSDYYCAWVMPDETKNAPYKAEVHIIGTTPLHPKSGPLNLFPSTYEPKNPNAKPIEGKAYTISPNVQDACPLMLPIQYLTDFNLAGGGEIATGKIQPLGYKAYYNTPGEIMRGTLGCQLRWSDLDVTNSSYGGDNIYDNRNSGYYTWYFATGAYDDVYNRQRHNVLEQPNTPDNNPSEKLSLRYYMPSMDDWAGIFPGVSHDNDEKTQNFWWTKNNAQHKKTEAFRLGGGRTDKGLSLITYCEYSDPTSGTTPDHHPETNEISIYALRFVKAPVGTTGYQRVWSEDGSLVSTFVPAPDNRFACLYRYTRVTDHQPGRYYNSRMMIEVIYLGEEGVAYLKEQNLLVLGATANPKSVHNHWDKLRQEFGFHDRYFKKILPATSKVSPAQGYDGYISSGYERLGYVSDAYSSPARVIDPFFYGAYWSTSYHKSGYGYMASWHRDATILCTYKPKGLGMPIRLFIRCPSEDPDIPKKKKL